MTKTDVQANFRESIMVGRLVAHLQSIGLEVRLEVPNMGQSTDIVASSKSRHLFVEAKVHDWKRAIEQCKTHELVADYICIAIGTVGVSNKLIAESRCLGYGIIHCPPSSDKCTWIVKPQRNRNYWPPQRERFSEKLRSIGCEH